MAATNNSLSTPEQNALSVSYDVLGTHVDLDLEFVKRYLVRGKPELVSDQEIVFYMNTCKMQKLNPLVNGEAYLIKYSSNDPASMVVGKDAYLRRAFDHPDYLFKEDGITVQRGNEIVQKEGCCLYPGEKLIGGWCRVHFVRRDVERSTYKEVSLSEYDKGQANWKTKPSTMINKVAISQCVRDAFPKDYEGLYSEEEMIASGAVPIGADGNVIEGSFDPVEEDELITQEQRQALFRMAQSTFGKSDGNNVVKSIINEFGIENTSEMRASVYSNVIERLIDVCKAQRESESQPSANEGENAPDE